MANTLAAMAIGAALSALVWWLLSRQKRSALSAELDRIARDRAKAELGAASALAEAKRQAEYKRLAELESLQQKREREARERNAKAKARSNELYSDDAALLAAIRRSSGGK